MLKEFQHLPHRPNVSIILFYEDNFLLVKRPEWEASLRKFPQGGIEEGESFEETALRELKEEVGTDNVEILGVSKYENTYDWSDEVLKRFKFKKYRGQKQRFVVARFLGKPEDVYPAEEDTEKVEWASRKKILNLAKNNMGTFKDYNGYIQKVFKEFNI